MAALLFAGPAEAPARRLVGRSAFDWGIEQALPASNPIQVLVPAPLALPGRSTGGSSSATRRCSTSPSTGAARSACRVPPGRPSTPRRPHRRTSRHEPCSSPRPSRARHGSATSRTGRSSAGRRAHDDCTRVWRSRPPGSVRPRGRPAAPPLLVHGPAPARANPEVRASSGRRLTTPDVWIDDVALAVMVHSRQWHADGLVLELTVEQDTDLQTARVVVVGVTPHSIRSRPRWVRERVETAYLEARATGVRADVVATRRDPWLGVRPVTRRSS